MTAKQILEELQAEEELLRRGWRKEKCTECNGSPSYIGPIPYPCWKCEGQSFIWNPPTPQEKSFEDTLMEVQNDWNAAKAWIKEHSAKPSSSDLAAPSTSSDENAT